MAKHRRERKEERPQSVALVAQSNDGKDDRSEEDWTEEVVRECRARWLAHYYRQFNQWLEVAESPIEVALYAALLAEQRHSQRKCRPTLYFQHQLGEYRVDVALWDPERGPLLAVEADGFDFHERTKEQATSDRQRDRAILKAGHEVIRFLGAEIYHDPQACAKEAFDVLESLCIREEEARKDGTPQNR